MKKTIKIEVTGDEILSMIMGAAKNFTVDDFKTSGITPESPNIEWFIKSKGDYDKGDFKEFLDKVIIEINE